MNTLPESLSPGSRAVLYADDSKVYRPILSPFHSTTLQRGLNNHCSWSNNNSLEFNLLKCKILIVTRKKNPILFPYMLSGNDLNPCSEEKDLGITLTYHLKWDLHKFGLLQTNAWVS